MWGDVWDAGSILFPGLWWLNGSLQNPWSMICSLFIYTLFFRKKKQISMTLQTFKNIYTFEILCNIELKLRISWIQNVLQSSYKNFLLFLMSCCLSWTSGIGINGNLLEMHNLSSTVDVSQTPYFSKLQANSLTYSSSGSTAPTNLLFPCPWFFTNHVFLHGQKHSSWQPTLPNFDPAPVD